MAEDSEPSTKYLSRAQRIIALSKEKADIMPELVKGTRNRNIPKRFIDFHTGLTNFPISAPKQMDYSRQKHVRQNSVNDVCLVTKKMHQSR